MSEVPSPSNFDGEGVGGEVLPLNILDYIYAVLHTPSYRAKYKEFLKIDFPRIPYPINAEQFFGLADKGRQLRELHLMKSPILSRLMTTYPIAGDNVVDTIAYSDGSVYINKTQYFGNVPAAVWKCYIGGYQPLQKYLKDRKGRVLTAEEIMHWQRIVVALSETMRIMNELG